MFTCGWVPCDLAGSQQAVGQGCGQCARLISGRAEHRGTGWRCLNLIKEGPAKAWNTNYMKPHDYVPTLGICLIRVSLVNQWLDNNIETSLLHAMNHDSACEAFGQWHRVDTASPPVTVWWQKGKRHTSKFVTASWDRPSTYGPRTLCSRTFRDCRLL